MRVGGVLTFFYCLFNTCETFQNLDYFVSSATAIGVPAWANDGSDDVVGILEFSDDAIIFPPLQGFFGRGNFRYMVQLQENLESGPSTPTALFSDFYRNQFAISVYYMKSANYVAIQTLRQPQELRTVRVIGLDDGRVWGEYADEDIGNAEGRFLAMPSRDGSLIAVASWLDDFSSVVDGVWPASFLVTFLSTANESLEPVFAPAEFTISVSTQSLYFSWALDGSEVFTITDFSVAAVEVNGSGGVTELPTVEPCTNTFPPTSSGIYRATDNGQVVLAPGGASYGVDLAPALPDFVCTN